MKKVLAFILTFVCIFGMYGCGSTGTVAETSNSAGNPVQNADDTQPNEKKDWSEQDIISLFDQSRETDWEYIDCILISDHASDHIGAVLFRDDQKQTGNVAFFDENGVYQKCGVSAKIPDEPDFTYLGDGAVTFKLEADDGTIYNCTLTISIDDGNVTFKAEDDLPEQQ